MADWYPVELPATMSDSGVTTYWVVDVDVNTDSGSGKRYGAIYYRCSHRAQAISLAESLNTPTP